MGRKRKYHTEKERQEAQRKWQMEHYLRNKEQIKQTKKTCCFFKPCSITKIFCAPIAKIKLSPVKNPNIRYSI